MNGPSKNIDAACQSEPHSSQAIRKGFAVEIVKPYDTPLGELPRTLVMTEKPYRNRDVAQRFVDCFVEATTLFLRTPGLADRFVRNEMLEGQLTEQDYADAIGNSPFSLDVTVQDVQTASDLMVKYGIGRFKTAPRATDWVKLDLLQKARAGRGSK